MKDKIDAIPLTVISDDASAIESFHSAESVKDDEVEKEEIVKKRMGGRRSLRVNSTYISQKDRLSRYKTAMQTFIPFRIDRNNNSHLPVDSVGCCSNLSFFWVRDFLLSCDDPVDSSQNRNKYEMSVIPPYNDRADVNGKRLLGIFKDEKQTRGTNGSMMKVAWNFCKTRVIIASIFYTLSTLLSLCAPVIFLRFTLHSLVQETANEITTHGNTTFADATLDMFKIIDFDIKIRGRFEGIYYMLGFAACFFGSKILGSITNWLNLRTAIRLRSAVISATFRQSIKSSIMNNISSNQILTDDIDNMMNLVDYLTKILGTVIAMLLAFICSIVLLRTPGVWPIFGAVGFFFIPVVLAKISTNRLQKSMHYLMRKLTVIESFCVNFKDVMIHAMAYDYIKQFYYFNSSQFAALRTAHIFSVRIYDGLTAVLLGGLYLIWCDMTIVTNSVETLVLVLVYVYFIKNFVADYCHSIEAISLGSGSLEKLKNSFTKLINPDLITSKMRTIDTRVFLSMNNCRFKWKDEWNAVFTLEVSKGDVLGVCGKYTKTLIYAMLGHIECKDGTLRQRGVTGFFSEDPFICIGSIKDNILMGSDFDAKRYYSAVNLTRLNEDVLQALGADELPIENLDLTKQQKQRVALARAIYSDRDVYLFDEPFKSAVFSSNILQILANVIQHIISSDPNKAVIICSSNTQILNICEKIYDTTENITLSRADYARISAASYHEGAVNYSFENVKGCCQNAMTVYKMPSRFHVQIVSESQQPKDESTEHLISKDIVTGGFVLGAFNLAFISILTFLNASIYVVLIVGFILVVKSEFIEPWLEFAFLGGFFLAIIIELIHKIYVAKVLEVRQKRFHKFIFEKLLNTSLDYLCGTNIADVLNWFSINFSSQFEPYTKIIKAVIVLCISGSFLLVVNYWLTTCVILILIGGQIFSFHIMFKGRLRSTFNYYTLVEFESRKRMLQHMINNIRGRDVIQSFGRTSEFCRDFNAIVEDNSTAVFLQKSVKNYVTFVLQMVIGVNVTLMHLLTLLVDDLSIYNYIFCIILYYLMMQYATELIVDGYIELAIIQCKRKLIDQEIKNITNNKQVSLLYEPSLVGEGGISIDFKEISVKLCGKKVLELYKLHISKGDIIGLTGNGSHLITSVLFKLLKPSLGVIFLGPQDLSLISQENLHSLIAVIPFDLHIQDLTILEFLNPSNSVNHKSIMNKLTLALPHLLQPNKLSESVRSLTRQQKQLLCLVKASLKATAKIIIFEFPELEIQPTINLFIRRDLIEKTIIVIGTSTRHFETCNRIINLDLGVKH